MKKKNHKLLTRTLIICFVLGMIIPFSCQEQEVGIDQVKLQKLIKEFDLYRVSKDAPLENVQKFHDVDELREALLEVQASITNIAKPKIALKDYHPSAFRARVYECAPQPCTASYVGGIYTFTYYGSYTSGDFNVSYAPSNGNVSSYITGFQMGTAYNQTNYAVQNQPSNVAVTTQGTVTYGAEIAGTVYGYTSSVTVITTYSPSTNGCTMQNMTGC